MIPQMLTGDKLRLYPSVDTPLLSYGRIGSSDTRAHPTYLGAHREISWYWQSKLITVIAPESMRPWMLSLPPPASEALSLEK